MFKFEDSISYPDYSSEVNIESIITAPLVAISKANVMMQAGQARFLLDNFFNINTENTAYEPVMIDMVMTRQNIDTSKQPGEPGYVENIRMTFSVPLICLVPLNSLALDKMRVDFDIEITSVTAKKAKTGKTGQRKVLKQIAQLHGKITNKHNQEKSGQYKREIGSRLMVAMDACLIPLPIGVRTILDIYSKTIQPKIDEK